MDCDETTSTCPRHSFSGPIEVEVEVEISGLRNRLIREHLLIIISEIDSVKRYWCMVKSDPECRVFPKIV